jgi:nucleoid-associated protein YgaU
MNGRKSQRYRVVSADRRFKITFLTVVLAVLVGFGGWYGFVREDGRAGEVAQDGIVQGGVAENAVSEAAVPDAVAPIADADIETVEQLPEGAAPGSVDEAVADAETELSVAAVDPTAILEPADPETEISASLAAPVFDIVRVEPTGDAVIAGRSFAGAVVELVRNGVVHDRIVADASGAFAFIPPPLPAGTSEIVLRVVAADGATRQSEQSVTVVVADDLVTTPMVAMVAPNQPTVVLSRPEERAIAAAATDPAIEDDVAGDPASEAASVAAVDSAAEDATAAQRQQIAAVDAVAISNGETIRIASVEAETGGGLYVTGEAAPSTTVRLYLNDTFVAPAEVGADGTVSFSIERGVRPGSYRVRLDQVADGTGSVLSRAEIVFVVPELPELVAEAPAPHEAITSPEPAEQVVVEAEPAPEAVPERSASTTIPEISTAVVTRCDSLWRISREIYGSGMRYTEIFEANQNQIRNPNLIYPGQLFVLPADPARAASPEGEQQSVN